jgi:hypothetical protein
VDAEILKNAVRSRDEDTCITWQATDFHNISTILDEINAENYGQIGNWTDENNRPLFCELEKGVVRTFGCLYC